MAQHHMPKLVTRGLILYLDAANRASYPGSGTTWSDLSGNGRNGILTSGPTFNNSNLGCISFNGTTNYVVTQNNTGLSGDINATLSVWVNFLELSTGFRTVCAMGSTGAMQGFAIFSNIAAYGAGTIAIGFFNANNCYTTSFLAVNTWYNLVATKSAGAVSASNTRLYVNGVQRDLTYSTSLTPNVVNSVAYIGNDAANEISNNMNVANFSMYNRSLTAAEVLQNFNATRGRFRV